MAKGELALPPALEAVLDGMPDRALADRLRTVHRAASKAIAALGTLNLVKYEPVRAEEGPADLDLFEKMAPAVADTVGSVTAALGAMRKVFPRAFQDPPPPPAKDAPRGEAEVESVLRAIDRRLQFELAEVRSQLRKPDVVASSWKLLGELQGVRAGFRRQLGDLVFLTANAFAHVQREVVVPGHQVEVSRAVELRRTAADFARKLSAQGPRLLAGVAPVQVLDFVVEDFNALTESAAWQAFPAAVKRALIQMNAHLTIARRSGADADALRRELEPVAQLLRALCTDLTTQLEAHDREVWAECNVKLEQVQLHLGLGSNGAPRILAEAVETIDALYGRDARLDAWLKRATETHVQSLQEAELREELEKLKEQLQVLPFH